MIQRKSNIQEDFSTSSRIDWSSSSIDLAHVEDGLHSHVLLESFAPQLTNLCLLYSFLGLDQLSPYLGFAQSYSTSLSIWQLFVWYGQKSFRKPAIRPSNIPNFFLVFLISSNPVSLESGKVTLPCNQQNSLCNIAIELVLCGSNWPFLERTCDSQIDPHHST